MTTHYILAQVYDYKGGELSTGIYTADHIATEILEMLSEDTYEKVKELTKTSNNLTKVQQFLEDNEIIEDTYASCDSYGYVGTIFKVTPEGVTEVGLNGAMDIVAEYLLKETT